MMTLEQYRDKAELGDAQDKLSSFRNRFTQSDDIYLDGNSLGKLPLKSIGLLNELINNQWGNRLIRSWNENWLELPHRIASKIATLVGAHPDEIFIGDTTSVNLFKLAYAALKFNKDKNEIVTDALNFPTDQYVLQGLVSNQFPDHRIKIVQSIDQITIDENEFLKAINSNTALVTLSHVQYKSAFLYDMNAINEHAHRHRALTLWDLSHATGAVPIKLNEWKADLAVGCTYKYLNGGPGSPAYLYIRKELQSDLINPIWAWFGHQRPFDFDSVYRPAGTIQKFATGTPSILSLAPVETGADLLLEAGIDSIREKSIQQTDFLLKMIRDILLPSGFSIASPLASHLRGSHISIQHPEAYRISKAMISPAEDAISIIPDFRPPNNLRLGVAALYTRYMDLWFCVQRMKSIVENEEYQRWDNIMKGVV